MSDIQLTADFSDIQTMNRELLETAKNARSSARVFESEYNKVERLLNKTAKTNQEYFNSVLRVGESTKSASASAEIFNKELNRQSVEVDRLSKKYNPLYRASKQYETALGEINRAHKVGAINIGQHEAAIEQLNAEYARFNSGIRPAANSLYQFGQQSAFAGKNANRFGMVSQQVGYQVGDFLVQVQSGTNALVAFGQQGTQLAGLLPGVAGAVIGIGLALSTAIGGVVMRQYFSNVSDLKDALKELGEESSSTADEIERLARGLSSVAQLQVAREIDRLQEEVERLQEAANNADIGGYGVAQERLRAKKEELDTLRATLETSKDLSEEEAYRASQSAIQEANVEAILRNRRDAAEEAARATSITAQVMAETYAQVGRAREESEKLSEAIYKSWQNGEDLSKLSVKDGINAAAIAAGELARQMGISLGLAQDIVAMGGGGAPGGPDQAVQQVRSRFEDAVVFQQTYNSGQSPSNSGSRGVGSQKADPLEQLRQRIKLETELLGKTEAQKEMIRALGVDQSKYTQDQIKDTEVLIEGLIKRQEEHQRIIDLQETLASSATDLFFAAAKGSDAFRESLSRLLQTLAEAIAKQAFLNYLEGNSTGQGFVGAVSGITKVFGFADGAAFNRGNVTAFAGGGVVSQPNFFPMSGGKTGLMGEAGPEAIMPLKRGRDGKLGVASERGSGTTVIQPQINIDARGAQQGVAEQINASITQALPTIIEATVSATRERNRRGAM